MVIREPFLRDEATHQALDSLAAKRDLVVYCGAGVTRDRTGVGWSQLVSEVFASVRSRRGRDRVSDNGINLILTREEIDSSQKASVIVQTGQRGNQTETQFLAPLLHRILYKDHGWSEGNLLGNVAELALFTATFGDDVSLITTNYDDYIDRELDTLIDFYFEDADPTELVPGLVISVLGYPKGRQVIREPLNGAGTITVYYIHGRVDHNGKPSGDIVFSESSYSMTRPRTVDFLTASFHNATAFLMLGASLDDPPLVEALFRADAQGEWREKFPVKVAVLAPGVGDGDQQTAWLDFAQLRGRHLGVTILNANNYGQVAQFVQELTLCKILDAQNLREQYSTQASYPIRLTKWWNSWNQSKWASMRDEHHEVLRDTLSEVETYLRGRGWVGEREILRLEMWVRLDPSVSSDSRHLTQYANSTGPFYMERALRKERIQLPSNVASVRAFTTGKPLLLGLEDLVSDTDGSRWKTFFSVPVQYDLELEFNDFALVGSVPAGVITLTSTYPLRKGDTMGVASFANPQKMKLADYKHLLTLLEDAGVLMVTPLVYQ